VLEREPQGITLARLAEQVAVTPRSVRRYLRELERTMDVESVETVPGRAHVWRLRPGDKARTIPLRKSQAHLVLAAMPLFESLKGSALYEEARLLREEVTRYLERGIRVTRRTVHKDPDEPMTPIRCHGPSPRSDAARGEIFDTVHQASVEGYVVDLRIDEGARATRSIALCPYALVLARGRVIAVGQTVGPPARIEAIALERVSDAARSDRAFRRPDDFDITAHLHGDQGVWTETAGTCVLEFDGPVAHAVRRRKLHPAQRMAASKDGRTRVQFPMASLDEATRLVLGFGESVRVVEPDALARRVAETASKIANRYRI
jgi:predicted DNA-binding transcriptional regulator YafY